MTKQRQKFEIEKAAQSTLSTDNKMLMDTCNQLEAKQHRTEHELQMKDARIQHLTDSLAQSKKSLDSESQKVFKSFLTHSTPHGQPRTVEEVARLRGSEGIQIISNSFNTSRTASHSPRSHSIPRPRRYSNHF